MKEPKIALVHDYLAEYGGAERTLTAIHDVFPNSAVFTSAFEPKNFPDEFKGWDIRVSQAQKLPFLNKLTKHYTFFYPVFFEGFDLSEFDIVISSWSIFSKAVITNPNQIHISYCHTPPRFLYKYRTETNRRNLRIYKPFLSYLDSFLRVWDYFSAQRPNYIIANSKNVQRRIKKFYGLESGVLNPPLNLGRPLVLPQGQANFDTSYFLIVSRLSAYKNIDLAIEAFNYMDLPLRIVGTGKEESRLKKLSKGNIAFLGKVPDRELSVLYQNCKGVINPVSDEDWGIVPLEAMSHGKPVLAHKSGGHLETIEPEKTGLLFENLSVEGLIEAVQKFDTAIRASLFDSNYLKQSVQKYDESIFKTKLRDFVDKKWEERAAT
ncbi:glycosyltransferase [candidate division WWE3 bacterium]|nr:glycosyltransferase [candidate division WWE3 bacterium]